MIHPMCVFTSTKRKNVIQIAVLIIDGLPGLKQENLIPSAQEAKAEGIEIFVVGALTTVIYGRIHC